jgi:lipoprotein-releasing system permease protein
VKGMQKNDIRNNKDLNKSLITNLDDFNDYSIILGKGVVRQIMAKKGDYVNLIVPIVAKTMFGTFPRQVKLKVVGVLGSNSQQYDNYMAIIPFETAKDIFSIKDGASSIEIMTNDPENLKEVESKISKIGKYYISDWKMENSGLLHALKVESNVMSLILGLFVVISVFTIFAVIRMMVKSKERDIAILKAHGISNSEIGKMFFIVGIVICATGMIFGNFLGILFALNVDDIRLFLENILHTTLLDGDVYLLSNLPSKIIVSDIIKINVFTFVLSLICILFSIKRNTKINVVEILRNN